MPPAEGPITIGFEETLITVEERTGFVEVCARVFSGQVLSSVTLLVFTTNGTAMGKIALQFQYSVFFNSLLLRKSKGFLC